MFSLGKSLTPPYYPSYTTTKNLKFTPYGIQLHFLTTKLLLEICLDWQCSILGSSYALKIQKGVWFGEAKFLLQMLVLLLRNTDIVYILLIYLIFIFVLW